ncbi:MAG: STAS domain-containing protein [Planctomycetota bacterium]
MIEYTSLPLDGVENGIVLELTGKLDAASSEYLLDCVQGFIDRGERKVVLDCFDLDSISSVGLGTLVRANSRLKSHGGTIALVGVQGLVADVLRVVHFDRLFGLYPDLDEAKAALANT